MSKIADLIDQKEHTWYAVFWKLLMLTIFLINCTTGNR
tara:strand:+ start:62 stop:175 length:114 start_codon:yes stop_codon:yes gene_type:complete